MTPRAILFDMDGVLVRSEEVWFRVVEEAGRLFRGRAISREEFFPTFGQGTAADVRVFGLSCSVADLDRFYVENFSKHLEGVWTNPEAASLLTALTARGIRRGVVTNTVSPLAEQILAASQLRRHFESLSCADLVPHAKPAPDLVLHGLKALGLEPGEAWMVGDSKFDREAARAAGVHFVGFGIDGDLRIDALGALVAHLGG